MHSHTASRSQQPLVSNRLPDIDVRMPMLKMCETPVEPRGIERNRGRGRLLGQVRILATPLPESFAVPAQRAEQTCWYRNSTIMPLRLPDIHLPPTVVLLPLGKKRCVPLLCKVNLSTVARPRGRRRRRR